MVTNKMTKIFSDKRGKILSLWWFIMVLAVAGGIIGMAVSFYGRPYDVRDIEANLLIDKLANCISYNGKINDGFLSENVKDNFLEECHINFSLEKDEFFYRVSFYNLTDLKNPFVNFNGGNFNLESFCGIEQEEALPKCVSKGFYSVGNETNQYLIKILVAVNKQKQNVK
jgi:hypothetical protein